MSKLVIAEVKNEGEHRWGLSLMSDAGLPLLRTITPMTKGVALSAAKALRQRGNDAPLGVDKPIDPETPHWFAHKEDDDWLLEFTLVGGILFDPLIKPEDKIADIKAIEQLLMVIKLTLVKAELEWDPAEADPAYQDKVSDHTETVGHPGS